MWYGKNAPAPAARMNPLYRSSSAPRTSLDRSRTKLPTLRFSWAPLEEPSRRRREEWKLQQKQLRRRPLVEGPAAAGPSLLQAQRSLPDLGKPLDGSPGSRPRSQPTAAAQLLQDRARPHSQGSLKASPHLAQPSGSTSLQSPANGLVAPDFVAAAGFPASASNSSRAARAAARTPPNEHLAAAETRSPSSATLLAAGAANGSRSSGSKGSKETKDSKDSTVVPADGSASDRSLEASTCSDSSRPSTAAAEEKKEKRPSWNDLEATVKKGPLLRRNTLADRLLEARLAKARPKQRQLLLEGRKPSKQAARDPATTALAEAEVAHDVRPGQFADGGGSSQPSSPHSKAKEETRLRAEAVFSCLARSGVITPGKTLAEAFLLLDHPYPNPEAVKSIILRHCGGRETLDSEDFVGLIIEYEERHRGFLDQIFAEFAGNSPTVAAAQVPRMLMKAGVPLMFGVAEEVIAEIREEVTFEDFERIHEDTLSRAGLPSDEHARISELFEAAEDTDGMLAQEEVFAALKLNEMLLSLAGGEPTVRSLAAQAVRRTEAGKVNLDLEGWLRELREVREGSIDKLCAPRAAGQETWQQQGDSPSSKQPRATGSALLAAARVLHEQIGKGLRHVMAKAGVIGDNVRVSQLVRIFEEAGFYVATHASIEHFLDVCGLAELSILTFDQLRALVVRYCSSEGFTDTEETDIAKIFQRFDADGSGTLEIGELGPVIRWLGYQPTQYRIYSFAEDFGLSEDSELDLLQFRRMVANYLKLSLSSVRKVFVNGAIGDEGKEIRASDLGTLMTMVGYEATAEEISNMIGKAGGPNKALDFNEFKRLEMAHRKHVRKTMEETGGVTNAELDRYKSFFKRNEERGQGYITQKAMRQLLADLFPPTSLNRERHVRIAQLVKEADADGNGMFDFQEYLWLMRHVTEEMDRDSLIQGLRLKKKLGYTSSEVKQFKDLYQLSDSDMSGSIDYTELVSLFSNLVNMEPQAQRELQGLFAEVDDGDGELDFWEFLGFMRKVQDMNWRNINGVAHG